MYICAICGETPDTCKCKHYVKPPINAEQADGPSVKTDIFNLELNDVDPPIPCALTPFEAGRLISFLKKHDEYKNALASLVDLKAHKDLHGKDKEYTELQPKVWAQAMAALKV